MKTALFISLFFFCIAAQAQLRLVKINLPSAAMGALSVSIEKVKKKQYSWQAGINYRAPISCPNFLYNQSNDGFETTDTKTAWIGAHAEYRFYTQKAIRLQTKPYLSFYSNYQLTQSQHSYSGPNKVNSTSIYTIDQNLQQISIGLQYGIQWVFNNRYSIDWTVLGFGISSYQLSGSLTTDEEGSIGRLEEAFSSVPIIGSKYLFKGSTGKYDLNSQFISPSPRTALRIALLF